MPRDVGSRTIKPGDVVRIVGVQGLPEVRWAQGREFGREFVRLRLEEKARLQRFLSSLLRQFKGGRFRQAAGDS